MNKLIIWFIIDVSFQKDASLHENTLLKVYIYINKKLYCRVCDSLNNMWRSIREKESNEVLTWREFEVQ